MTNRISYKLETMFAAVAFAEAGEFETARELMREEETPTDARQTE